MPRPGGPRRGAPVEKAKDFKGAAKRLIKELKKFELLIIISLILAMFGAMLSIMAPDKLAQITDTITQGLRTSNIDIDKIKSIALTLTIMYITKHFKHIKIEKQGKGYTLEYCK